MVIPTLQVEVQLPDAPPGLTNLMPHNIWFPNGNSKLKLHQLQRKIDFTTSKIQSRAFDRMQDFDGVERQLH